MKKILLVLIWLFLTVILAIPFGRFYQLFIPQGGSLFIVSQEFVDIVTGIGLSWVFSLILLFTAFGGAKKYWWIGIALIPAVLFEVAFDLQHLYFPIAIGLVGWLLGKGVGLIMKKFNTSPISPPPPRQ